MFPQYQTLSIYTYPGYIPVQSGSLGLLPPDDSMSRCSQGIHSPYPDEEESFHAGQEPYTPQIARARYAAA